MSVAIIYGVGQIFSFILLFYFFSAKKIWNHDLVKKWARKMFEQNIFD